ncbi:MAG TPA: universal stress protein [Rhodospirillales bacterium]|nr:universal stress protein [Rhodospirillales bacterium]
MKKYVNILLASHGTPGAQAAEAAALEICSENGGAIDHLNVIPDFWKGMMGDDWLNNAVTQARFGKYVENQLAREVAEEADRLDRDASKFAITCNHDFIFGKPVECLVEKYKNGNYDLIVMGSLRPKGAEGYCSRIKLDVLLRAIEIPVLVIPHPPLKDK